MFRKRYLFLWLTLLLALLACQVLSAPLSEEEKIRQMLEGRTAVVFGNKEFVTNATSGLEPYHMNIQIAESLIDALSLAGDGFIELHCVYEGTLVVHAERPDLLIISTGETVVECHDGGVIFVGFSTETMPNLRVTD